MKIFIDTASIEEINQIQKWLTLDGVTTNPSLIAKTGEKIETLIPKIADLVEGSVSAEVVETKEEPMFQEALKLHQLHKNVVVKIPLIKEGLNVVKRLKKEGIPTNVTLCFSPVQALLAAKAGASLVSIFVGRLDDIDHSGIQIVEETCEIFSHYDLKSQVLAASIRHQQHVLESAMAGASIITAPYKILKDLIHHPLTDIGLEQFLKSAGKLK